MAALARLVRTSSPAMRSVALPRTVVGRFFSKADDKKKEESAENKEGSAKAAEKPADASGYEEIIAAQLQEIKDITDKYKRSLAENENVRRRAEIEVQNAKEFAIQKFCKDITPVADILQAALDSIPAEKRGEKADKDLKTLFEGVEGTHKMMLKVFERNGLTVIHPVDEKFDPNMHEALCEVPDPTKATGDVAFVQKSGYVLKGRVIRAATVGVVRNPK